MSNKFTSSSSSDRYHQAFFRWNLDSSIAALWQLAAQQACQPLGIQATWFDLGDACFPINQMDVERRRKLEESISNFPPAAIILGIEQANFPSIVAGLSDLRMLGNRWPRDVEDLHETSIRNTFLIGWFPQADHDAIHLLRELGIDLVLHNPASLRPALEGVARYGYRSKHGTEKWVAEN